MGRQNIATDCGDIKKMVFIRKYWLVILGTLVVALFTGLPSIFFFQRMGDDFKGVYPVFNGDALFYQARVREIADGHLGLNHQYFFEHKNIVYPQQIGAEYFIYGLTKILAGYVRYIGRGSLHWIAVNLFFPKDGG